HGAYLNAEQVADWKGAVSPDDKADSGLSVLKTGAVLQIVAVAPGSPADAAKIVAGDQLRKIDGKPIRTLSLDQAQRMLVGAPGTSVKVELLRIKDFSREVLTLDRKLRTDPAYTIDVAQGVAILKIHDFERLPNDALVADLGGIKD